MNKLRGVGEIGFSRMWNVFLRFVLGYGYYPAFALAWFAGLVALGFMLFAGAFLHGAVVPTDKEAYIDFTRTGRVPDYYESFHPLIYSLENSLPLLKLGQVERWQPETQSSGIQDGCHSCPYLLRLFRWLQVIFGWIFATMWIGGATGLIRDE